MDSRALLENLKAELTCSMCLGYCPDPVTVQCGHSFWAVCLLQGREGANESVTCPHCRGLRQVCDLGPNGNLPNLPRTSPVLRRHLRHSMVSLTSCGEDGQKRSSLRNTRGASLIPLDHSQNTRITKSFPWKQPLARARPSSRRLALP